MKVGDVSVSPTLLSVSAFGQYTFTSDVLFDTGCSFNYMNNAFVTELTKQLAKMEMADFLGVKWYRCDADYVEKYPNLTVGLKNIDLTLDVYNYLYFTAPLQKVKNQFFVK